MSSEVIVALGQKTLEMAVLLAAPLLIVLAVVSLVISVVQTLTSLQDATISSVPRLLAAAVAGIVLMPWMLRKLGFFTMQLFADFRRCGCSRAHGLDTWKARCWAWLRSGCGSPACCCSRPFFGSDAVAPASRSDWWSPSPRCCIRCAGRAAWS